MFKLIWSHYEPVTKVSVVLICLTTLILAFYQVFGRPPDKSLSLMKHGSNMWTKVHHSAHKHIFRWYFPRKMSHFCSNSYDGVQVKYASHVYRWVHEHIFRWYIPRKMSHFCSNSYGGVQVKYASRARFSSLANLQSLRLVDSVGEPCLLCHLSLLEFREDLSSKTFKRETKVKVSASALAISLHDTPLLSHWKSPTSHWDFEVRIPSSTSTENTVSQDYVPS